MQQQMDNSEDLEGRKASDIEAVLSAIMRDVLEIDHVPSDTLYAELGGNSVSLFIIVERLQAKLGVKVDPQLFFHPERATLRGISRELTGQQGGVA